MAPHQQQARRTALGLTDPAVAKFTNECEFVSLGCYCAPSYALQALGLKRYSYPFDWVRSPVEGIIQCLNSGFADFLTYTTFRNEGPHGTLFTDTRWGGSFWHHDINQPKVRDDFSRRIDRMLGRKEVPASTPRVFVWVANSSSELNATLRLYSALRRVLSAAKIYLLVIIDLQCSTGPMAIDCHDSILFYKVHENLTRNTSSIQARSEIYFEAIAAAATFWAGRRSDVVRMQSLPHLSAVCDAFDGGNPGSELYAPGRSQCAPIAPLTSPPLQGPASLTYPTVSPWGQSTLPPSPAGSGYSEKGRLDDASNASTGSCASNASTASVISNVTTVGSFPSVHQVGQSLTKPMAPVQTSSGVAPPLSQTFPAFQQARNAPQWSAPVPAFPASSGIVTPQSTTSRIIGAPTHLGGWRSCL